MYFQGKRVEIRAADIGYNDERIKECICSIKPPEFHETKYYEFTDGGKKFPYDVYLVSRQNNDGDIDDLYIKFRLSGPCLIIASFHLQQF